VGPDPDPKPFKFCTNNLQQEIFGPKDEYRFTLTVNWGLTLLRVAGGVLAHPFF
jgi:hypothetical protein